MSRQSPAVGRIVSVLNFFVEHPQQAFTLTQVVKSLRLSRATTHAILLGLVDAGYLYRRPDKSYVLGPVLHSLATSAHQHFSPLAVASQEMRALADEFDVVATALFADGDEVVVRERAASVNHLGWFNPMAARYSMFPWGSAFLVPLTSAEVEARLDRVSPPLDASARREVMLALEFGRRHDFIAALVPEDERTAPDYSRPSGRFVSDLGLGDDVSLRFVEAPVFGPGGEVAFVLALAGFNANMSGAEVMRIGRSLRDACDRIGSFMTGKRLEAAQ